MPSIPIQAILVNINIQIHINKKKVMTADITEEELKDAISRLKLSKSLGSDGYTAEWYKGI